MTGQTNNTLWNGARVLVTGATGMVGSWLVKELLARKSKVHVLLRDADPQSELLRSGDLNKTSVIQGELEDLHSLERALAEHSIEVVFHLGAQTIVGVADRAPLLTFEANIRGSYQLLEACRRQGPRAVIVASSDKAYGTQVLPYHEGMPLEGRMPYEVSKSCTDLLTQSYFHAYKLPCAIARCGNIFGGGDLNWSRIIPGTIRSFLQAEAPVIRSDGTFIRDYIFVKDVVSAYLHLVEAVLGGKAHGEAFNFSLEQPLSVLALVDEIRRVMNVSGLESIIHSGAKSEIHDQYLDAAKARNVLGWQPRHGLEEGLRETVAWYTSFLKEQQS